MTKLIKQIKNLVNIVKAIWEFLSSIIDGFVTLMTTLDDTVESILGYQTVLPGVLYILIYTSLTLIIVKMIVGR